MCPVSTRIAKHDIHYLLDDEVDHLARELGATRLAMYEYNDPAQPEGRRLGFIIEDQPAGSPAVAADRGHVDLYGYACSASQHIECTGNCPAPELGSAD